MSFIVGMVLFFDIRPLRLLGLMRLHGFHALSYVFFAFFFSRSSLQLFSSEVVSPNVSLQMFFSKFFFSTGFFANIFLEDFFPQVSLQMFSLMFFFPEVLCKCFF